MRSFERRRLAPVDQLLAPESFEDRKSTRLNSSHSQISYAGFCLKKKSEFIILIITFVCLTPLVASGLRPNSETNITIHVKGIQGNEKLDIFLITVTSLADLSPLL